MRGPTQEGCVGQISSIDGAQNKRPKKLREIFTTCAFKTFNIVNRSPATTLGTPARANEIQIRETPPSKTLWLNEYKGQS